MYTVILANKSDENDPSKKAHKAIGRTFPTLELAQANADKRNSMLPPQFKDVKEYRVIELSIRAQHAIRGRGETLTIGETNRRLKLAM